MVSNQNFPLYPLDAKQIKNIYLKKITQIGGVPLVPLHINATEPLRGYFEKYFLHKTGYQMKKYWLKAHYKGVRPPKSVGSTESIVRYIMQIDGAIAYLPKSKVLKSMKIHLEIEP